MCNRPEQGHLGRLGQMEHVCRAWWVTGFLGSVITNTMHWMSKPKGILVFFYLCITLWPSITSFVSKMPRMSYILHLLNISQAIASSINSYPGIHFPSYFSFKTRINSSSTNRVHTRTFLRQVLPVACTQVTPGEPGRRLSGRQLMASKDFGVSHLGFTSCSCDLPAVSHWACCWSSQPRYPFVYSKRGPQTAGISISWELVGNTETRVSPRPTDSSAQFNKVPDNSRAPSSLRLLLSFLVCSDFPWFMRQFMTSPAAIFKTYLHPAPPSLHPPSVLCPLDVLPSKSWVAHAFASSMSWLKCHLPERFSFSPPYLK